MEQRVVRVSIEAGAYVALLGLIAWGTGRPFIFPSLGPTAIALTLYPKANSARAVLGGHLCGVIAGLLAYHVFASGLMVTSIHTPLSVNGLWLALSGALSVFLTPGSMLITRTVHAPACATTLIISLGLLPGIVDGGIIMTAVILLYGAHRLLRGIEGM
ncbi:MAG: HPP family protein [Gammaproteobacteria bacterium]